MRKIFIPLMIVAGAVSCNKVDAPIEIVPNGDDVKEITIVADLDAGATKVVYSDAEVGGVIAMWDSNDKLGVFSSNSTASQNVLFTNSLSEPATKAAFTGGVVYDPGDWIYCYHPYSAEDVFESSIYLTNLNRQVQTGNNSTSHCLPYDLMISDPIKYQGGDVEFGFTRMMAMMRFNITFDPTTTATKVTRVVMNTSQDLFYQTASVNATQTPITLVKSQGVSSVTLEVIDGDLSGEKDFTAYMMFVPTDLTGENIEIIVTTDAGEYKIIRAGRAFIAGMRYRVPVDLSSLTPTTVTSWSGTALTADGAYAYHSGDGSQNNPYMIATPYDMAMLSANTNGITDYSDGKYFKMLNNIDLGAYEWTPIGTSTNQFKGVFDGNGKIITQLKLTTSVTSPNVAKGLFGYISGGSVLNLTIDKGANGSILVKNNTSSGMTLGAIVGDINGGAIDNCVVNINLSNSGSGNMYTHNKIGGVAGVATGTIISNCINTGEISVNTAGSTWNASTGGGIAGELVNGTIINSINRGYIYTSASNQDGCNAVTGGIVGEMKETSMVFNSYNTARLNADSKNVSQRWTNNYLGGIAGIVGAGSLITNCYSSSPTHTVSSTRADSYRGGIAGTNAGTIEYCYWQPESSGGTVNTVSGSDPTNTYQFSSDQMKGLAAVSIGTYTSLAEALNAKADDYNQTSPAKWAKMWNSSVGAYPGF